MTAPQTNPASPDRPDAWTLILLSFITMVLWGGLLVLFGHWLYGHYAAMPGWTSGTSLFGLAAGSSMIAIVSCRKPGWRAALIAFLAASVFTATLALNIVAAAAILWAVDPSLTAGWGGYFATVFAGIFATLPVAFGAIVLAQRWQPAQAGHEGEAEA